MNNHEKRKDMLKAVLATLLTIAVLPIAFEVSWQAWHAVSHGTEPQIQWSSTGDTDNEQ